MDALVITLSAYAALTIIAISGWVVALETKKRNGALEKEVELLKEDRLARMAQDASFARNRHGDLASDRDFLPDADDDVPGGVRREG